MNDFSGSQSRALALTYVSVSFGLFLALFAVYHQRAGNAFAALAIIPIVLASWHFGIRGGLITTALSILSYWLVKLLAGESFASIFDSPSTLIGALALVLTGIAVGRLATVSRERRMAFTRLSHSNELIYSLLHVTTQIERTLTPSETAQSLGKELLKVNIAHALALYERDSGLFQFEHASPGREIPDRAEIHAEFPSYNHTFTMDQLNPSPGMGNFFEPVVVESPERELQVLFHHLGAGTARESLTLLGIHPDVVVFRLPLLLEDTLIGILWVWGSGITEANLPVLSIFAKQIAITLERARLFQEVQDLALTDHLTSLHNRRSLFELGRIEFSRAKRWNRPFCCLMLDLDHFKQINDNFGHPAGDRVLQEFAKLCKDSVREIDLVARYGGEELIILMPETELETSIQVAERLRAIISATEIVVENQALRVTVSIGAATKDENTTGLETLIARADQAMYMAKHKGRNCVAVSK